MMRLRENRRWLLLLVGITLVAAYLVYFSLPPPNTNPVYQDLSVDDAKDLIDTTPSLVILDVRTVAEYAAEHIEGAVHIPVVELASRITELDWIKEQHSATLVYCRSGVRSAQAAQILVEHGFTPVYNMLDGLLDWINQGYPTTT
jgi:rhodanese-related sulfurtransferase